METVLAATVSLVADERSERQVQIPHLRITFFDVQQNKKQRSKMHLLPPIG